MTIDGLLTVNDVAQRTNRDPESVRRWIRAKRLPAAKIGSVYLVKLEDFANFTPPVPRGRSYKHRLPEEKVKR